jgi:hypothetical protein
MYPPSMRSNPTTYKTCERRRRPGASRLTPARSVADVPLGTGRFFVLGLRSYFLLQTSQLRTRCAPVGGGGSNPPHPRGELSAFHL